MQNQPLPACPKCGRAAQVADAAFCPYCGAAMQAERPKPLPEGARSLLQKAREAQDPRKKHDLLTQADKEYPDCLEIAQELLFLGRLYERSPRKLDYSVIKCYLFQPYLTPDEFTGESRAAMRNELFEHPQLKRCQDLAADAGLFTRQYLERLADEYIRLFLRGSNRYMQSFFGISLDSRAPKLLARPAAVILRNIRKDTELDAERRETLYNAFYSGFARQMGGETKWLDDALEAEGLPAPAENR